MGELKQHQPPMTIDEQVENLKSLGLIINDEEYAKKILKEISDYIFKNYEEVLSIRLKIADDNIYSSKTAWYCGYLNIPGTQMYVSFNPYVNSKDKIKF